MLIDTHAHLYWEDYKDDFDKVIQHCLDAGVTTVINVGVDVELSKKALRQAQGKLQKIPANFTMYSTIGIHPHEAIKYLSDSSVSIHEDINKLEEIYLSNRSKCIGVGECGLDFFLDRNDIHPDITLPPDQIKEGQKQLFQAQIDLAKKLNLLLIVHCRDDRSKDPQNSEAWDQTLEMIGDHPAILHCYSGLEKTTKKVLEMPNALVSFAGTITYPKNDYLREAAKVIPLEKIVLETDCPFLPPQSIRGQRNEPSSVLEIAKLIADIKGISLEEIANQTTENVKRLFNIDPSSP